MQPSESTVFGGSSDDPDIGQYVYSVHDSTTNLCQTDSQQDQTGQPRGQQSSRRQRRYGYLPLTIHRRLTVRCEQLERKEPPQRVARMIAS
jgi:hypothetical protein